MMFISKFNKLIRNKYIWSGFAFIVILSFVAWQTNTGGISEEETKNAAGKLDGKPVPAAEMRSAYFNSYLYMSLMVGRPLKVTPRVEEALKHMAWRRLIALRGAQEARLSSSPEEVVAAIQQQPFFQEKGQFSRARYVAFVQQFLANLRATENQFEDHIRQEIIMSKARLMLAQATWVAPLEVEEVYHQLYDTFVVSYVLLTRDDLEHTVKVTDTETRAYFEAHTNDFTIPAKMRVKYVSFPFARFLDEGALDEADLRSYYDEHIEEFTTRGTGDLLSARSFEEVEDTLRDQLAREAADVVAGDQAADFEVTLAPDRKGQAPSFETVARTVGLAVTTSAVFTLNGSVPGLQVGLDFNKAAFTLRPTPDDYFSHPVRGSNAYYVLAFDEKIDARVPAYDEVRAEARQAALELAGSNKLAQTAESIHQTVADALQRGKTFAQAIRPYRLEVVTTDPFAVRTGLDVEDKDTFFELTKKILFLNAGELTDVIPVEGGVMIGRVDSRIMADRTLLASIKNDLSQYIRKRREDLAFREWQEYLLTAHKFEDAAYKKTAVKDDSEESDEKDTDSESADNYIVD
ncbi:MAG: SurA N-terminal domain-containing protein [Verrucomicrobia bacterium]|nr:SurA N-terminal domain-containing protein [Verrucomicrobiota bacterium]MBU1735357.1 SurA N-terminal domain-containing protein [Verrucomicrobiota bacterium]MBU1857488.1 SurA N-terminal domain-containing protein [Verrucomicrobiota bacterium]